MSTIQVTARGAIHEGKLEEFKALAADCMRTVREKDLGTTQYDWFFSEDKTQCVVRESYKDSNAVLAHIANLGPTLAALLKICDWTFDVYGSPSPELVKASERLTIKIYSPFQSLS